MDESSLAPMARPEGSGSGADVGHYQWGLSLHESCQYNFFCDDKFFCVRLIELRDFRHQSAWVYDGEVRELLNAGDVIEREGDERLQVKTPRFLMESDNAKGDNARGSVTVLSESGSPELEMKWTIPVSTSWATPGEGSGLHQPLLKGEVTWQGQTYTGPGYCKRAWFDLDPQYWGWRFIEGAFDEGQGMIWSADATFGIGKYDYFKIAYADGTVLAADNQHTHHRDNIAYGTIDGKPFEAEVEEIGLWKTKLLGKNMDTQMRQRYCKLTLRHGGEEHKGYALNETGSGTMR